MACKCVIIYIQKLNKVHLKKEKTTMAANGSILQDGGAHINTSGVYDTHTSARQIEDLIKHKLTKTITLDPINGLKINGESKHVKKLIDANKKYNLSVKKLYDHYQGSDSKKYLEAAYNNNTKVTVVALPVSASNVSVDMVQLIMGETAKGWQKSKIVPVDTLLLFELQSRFPSITKSSANVITSLGAVCPEFHDEHKCIFFYQNTTKALVQKVPKLHLVNKSLINIPELLKAKMSYLLFMVN
jgi:hypothetical protein